MGTSIRNYFKEIRTANPKSKKGYFINQYTCGVALLESPFFLVTHYLNKKNDQHRNGYTANYEASIKTATMCYAILGLLLVFMILHRSFSVTISLIGTLLLFIGTNLFHFVLHQQGMAHVPQFFLVALLLYTTIRLLEKPSLGWFTLMGICLGLITLIRPTDGVFIVVPLLYGVKDITSLRNRIQFILLHRWKLAFLLFVAVLVWVPQLIYWKTYTGQWFYYSYGNQGFNWSHPEILKGLFGSRNGWFVFTPLMALSFFGLLWYKRFANWLVVLIVVIPVYIYVAYSWYNFNYINGLGSRPMIHLYPLMALPLTALVAWLFHKKSWKTMLASVVLVCCIGINLNFIWKNSQGDLWAENASFPFLVHTFFKTKITYNDLLLMDLNEKQPVSKPFKNAHTLIDGSVDSTLNCTDEEFPKYTSWQYKVVNETLPFSYLRCTALLKTLHALPDLYKQQMLVITVESNKENSLWKAIRINNKIGIQAMERRNDYSFHLGKIITHQWDTLQFVVKLAQPLKRHDIIRYQLWNAPAQPIRFQWMKLEGVY